jgi:hypothetical protein
MSETEKLAVPTVHLNGTSKADLLEQQAKAREKINETLLALQEASPHPRDYYVQGTEIWNLAVKQHQARVKRFQQTYDELMQISFETDAQGN